MKKPWYLQTWFICLLFLFWPSVITLIFGVFLLIRSYGYEKEINQQLQERYAANERDLQYKYEQLDKELDEEHHRKILAIDILCEQQNELKEEIEQLTQECLLESVSIEAYENLKSDEVKNQLQMLKIKQNEMVKDGSALKVINASVSKKIEDAQKKQILRCFNSESTSIIELVTVKNVDTCRNKLQRSFENLNKLFKVDGVEIAPKYFETKLEELSMVYAYMVKLEEEKELARAIREQMQEEEKVRREIEREKQKIEKEETQFKNEVNKLMKYLHKAADDIERQLYLDKIQELEEKLKAMEKDKQNVLEREQNTRAGFVYVISNIGAFGENVYKIGMTRRLEPMDRVKELGDASVPFPFDVHAMIFSDDAPALENTLHQTFKEYQVNKVNPRKEFFSVDLEKVKQIVKENHNATVHFVDIPEAVEYRESIRITQAETAAIS